MDKSIPAVYVYNAFAGGFFVMILVAEIVYDLESKICQSAYILRAF